MPDKYTFRNSNSIGANDARQDKAFLEECFIDQGQLAILQNTEDYRCIVLGRTGAGKTALLERMADEERHIKIEPHMLSLAHISNSQVIKFFVSLGVKMDLFYRLLWRHVFVVEILKRHYEIINESRLQYFLEAVKNLIGNNKNKQKAINYLVEWGGTFWNETEHRVKEVTTKMENDMQRNVALKMSGQFLNVGGAEGGFDIGQAKKLSEEKRVEILQHGQSVVNDTQIGTLTEVMKILQNDILEDKKKKYYITIDRLDEQWVEDDIRYHLIRALLETINDMNEMLKNVKIIVALREDLLARVFRFTRDSGHQEEKYRSLYLTLSWSGRDLEKLLDRRINALLRNKYESKSIVRLKDVLPKKIPGSYDSPIQYILSRTMMRPRDAISFVNESLVAAAGHTEISFASITAAERIYSKNRLRALADEWFSDYPNLIDLITCLLRQFPPSFTFEYFTDDVIVDFLQRIHHLKGYDLEPHKNCPIIESIIKYESDLDLNKFLEKTLRILVKVGAVGVKPNPITSTLWGYNTELDSDVNSLSKYYIHPAFYRVLSINDREE